jgi:putative sigma-54 modulation protein
MELQLTGQGVEILPTVRSYIEKKFDKLDRHFPNIVKVIVELNEQKTKSQGKRFRAQVTLHSNGTLLRAEEQAENILVAIDRVVPVIDRQIERYKGRVYKKGKNGPSIRTMNSEQEETFIPKLVRTKRFVITPMSVDDAIDQMELLGHDFFLFRNIATKEINLLYKREDGNYSIIEAQID